MEFIVDKKWFLWIVPNSELYVVVSCKMSRDVTSRLHDNIENTPKGNEKCVMKFPSTEVEHINRKNVWGMVDDVSPSCRRSLLNYFMMILIRMIGSEDIDERLSSSWQSRTGTKYFFSSSVCTSVGNFRVKHSATRSWHRVNKIPFSGKNENAQKWIRKSCVAAEENESRPHTSWTWNRTSIHLPSAIRRHSIIAYPQS